MRRFMYGLTVIVLFACIPAIMVAQDTPIATEDPTGGIIQDAPTVIVTEEIPQIAVPEGAVPIPTAVGLPADTAPVPTQPPAPTSAIDPVVLPILIAVRTDMELFASQQLGAERPVGWSGSLDINDPSILILARLDLELLAGRLVDPNIRPPGWFGAVAGTQLSISRDIRHDLELLADTVDVPNVRPVGWVGGDPLMRCDRAIQALVNVLERGGVFSLNVDSNDFNFCQLAEVQASTFAEQSVLANAGVALTTTSGSSSGVQAQGVALPGSVQIDSNLAVAFLNRFGTENVGTIPSGTSVSPIARSFTQFSRMTLVRGDGFEVFIDFRDTTLTDDQFAALPNVDGVEQNTVCNAAWCKIILYTLGNPASGRQFPGQ